MNGRRGIISLIFSDWIPVTDVKKEVPLGGIKSVKTKPHRKYRVKRQNKIKIKINN